MLLTYSTMDIRNVDEFEHITVVTDGDDLNSKF